MLLHSFYNFDYVLRLPMRVLNKLIDDAEEEQEKRKAWEMWLQKYPHMNKKDFISFNKFYRNLREPAKTKEKKKENSKSAIEQFIDYKKRIKKPK